MISVSAVAPLLTDSIEIPPLMLTIGIEANGSAAMKSTTETATAASAMPISRRPTSSVD